MTPSEIDELLMMLVAAYPNMKVTDATTKLYEVTLADLDEGLARRAVIRIITTSKFPPTIAEIREACSLQSAGPVRSGADAYGVLMEAVRRHGRCYGEPAPEFSDPLIAKCIGVWGSWNDLCNSPSADPGGRARFIELYDELARAARQDQVSGQALPRPQPIREFWIERERRELTAANDAQSIAPIVAIKTAPKPQGPNPNHRKFSNEELEQQLAKGAI